MMLRLLSRLGAYWYFLAAGAGAGLLVGVYLSFYFRSLRPRAGTLEWIERYDRPAFAVAGQWHGLTRRDAAFLLPACLLSAAVWCFAAFQSWRASGADALRVEDLIIAALYYAVAPAGAAAAVYVLLRGLFDCAPAALLGALVLSLDLTVETEAVLLAAWMLLFLARFFTAGADRSFAAACLPLALCAAMLAAGCLLPGMWLLAAGALVLLLAGCAARFVELGKGWLWQSLALFLPIFLAVTWLLYLPAALLGGMTFPQAPLSADYARLVAARWSAGFREMRGFDPLWLRTVLFYDWPTLFLGLGATLAALLAARRRRGFRAGLLGLSFLILAVLWLLGGPYALPLGCILSLGSLWADLYRRRAFVLFAVGPALLAVWLGALYAVTWIL